MVSLPLPKLLQTDDPVPERPRLLSEPGIHPHAKPASTQSVNETQKQEEQLQIQTECVCMKTSAHFPHTVMDQTYDSSLQQMYNLLYHSGFLQRFLTTIQKNTGIMLMDVLHSTKCTLL